MNKFCYSLIVTAQLFFGLSINLNAQFKGLDKDLKLKAASKLKKAQSLAEKGRSYSSGLDSIVKGLVNSSENIEHPLLGNNVGDKNSSLIVMTNDAVFEL